MLEIPQEFKDTCQALAYWIGYKQELYRQYPIREGEIVGELLSLLSSKFNNDKKINAEVLYKKLHNNIGNRELADIVISSKNDDFSYSKHAEYIIEVKRKQAPKKDIKKDFKKLSNLKKLNNDLRCFVLYISPNERPKDMVNDKGNTLRFIQIDDTSHKANIRLVKKSLDKFYTYRDSVKVPHAIEKANYVCLLEIC